MPIFMIPDTTASGIENRHTFYFFFKRSAVNLTEKVIKDKIEKIADVW